MVRVSKIAATVVEFNGVTGEINQFFLPNKGNPSKNFLAPCKFEWESAKIKQF